MKLLGVSFNHNSTYKSHSALFEEIFSMNNIEKTYNEKIIKHPTIGIDGITVKSLNEDKEYHFYTINKKCIDGNYKFSPYLQKLISKGRSKEPRVISIPTLRDKIVLLLIKEYLYVYFNDCINRKLPNKTINNIKEYLAKIDDENNPCYYKLDISEFYDNIRHQDLFNKLKKRIEIKPILNLLTFSIQNITIPIGTSRQTYKNYIPEKGIPQGLSISNILANIYLNDIDNKYKQITLGYYRYVDDILLFNHGIHNKCLKPEIEDDLTSIGLPVNKIKSNCFIQKPEFDYLGYSFDYKKISVKQEAVDRYINSIVAKFIDFRKKTPLRIKKDKEFNVDTAKKVFIEKLNEKITGAISENKKYGWIFYFIEIDDLQLLYKLDFIIEGFFKKLNYFNNKKPSDLKRLVRSFYEAKHNPSGNYIHNYDKYITTIDKIMYLVKIGEINEEAKHRFSTSEIDYIFNNVKFKNLSGLEEDLSMLS